MTTRAIELLTALQHADSFFPSGAMAFSWGLETLAADRIVCRTTLQDFLRAQIEARWASFDRPFLVAAMQADDTDIWALDREVHCRSLALEQREGSMRAGRSLLAVHERLGTPGCDHYRREWRKGSAHGHLPVVQGFLFARLGLEIETAELVSAYGAALSVVSAAVRLGLVGAVDAQHSLSAARETIASLLQSSAPSVWEASAYVPQAEIAMMRHETQTSRLFSN